ncbi:hypothetical protein MATR_00610 [Marivirga tractuosa]|uniref:histidine kinase n=1 Tax=Marivirga tractuosa (strain ATCC 23168 / DSM 4126 / NBRC 15989 / NCIMB 1408 / VKM B-1430 / H-43) TaxID=643867 RepID=E4TLJ3_MARTH|nr:PAS domain S-box protein [Marivirga tractuosa]ADR22297.1 multi-sensor signal transduction histidine kinase [Marivirga tractuosa DSM 4126]BDD13236.1 hypothetical protein MATR_00610 [Marivirga tractuosa]
MKKPQIPINERDRQKELESYQIIGLNEEDEFDFITSMAAKICESKISLISLVTGDKQWFLSHHGVEVRETSKNISFCAHAINIPDQAFIVEDARQDTRFFDNPITTGDPNVIFYAGIPLVNKNGFPLGTLCVIDDAPKKLNEEQIQLLQKLAKQTLNLLELRRSQRRLVESNQDLNKKNQLLTVTEEANQIGTWELDIASGQTVWSKVVYEIHELPLDYDHNKAKAIEFYHPDYRSLITQALENVMQNDVPFDLECKLITAKGRQKWVRSTGRKVENKIIGSFQDITKIKDSELKFKSIFNSTFTFIGFLSTEGILLEANDTAIGLADLKHEDVIGKYFWDCYWWQISPQTQKELKRNFQKAVGGETVSYEVEVWLSNKTPITILFSMKPIFDEFGKVIYVLPEGSPIQEIVDARRKYKSVIEGTNVGTWEWNVQTGETEFNERWAEIVGYTLDELAPISIDTWMNLAHPDDLEESGRRLNECFEKKAEYYDFEARMKHKDGHWVWVLDRGKVFEWTKEGKPLMMYGTHQDISERKQKEEALRISEEAFRGNFENAAIGMALLDQNGKWLKVNKNVCQTVGYSKEELLELTFQDITHPDDLHADLDLLQELVEGKRNHYQMEKRYFHKEGHIVYIILAVSMVKDERGNVLYFISQIIDISKLKKTEIRLKALLAENKALMDATTEVAFVSTDKEGNILDTNIGVQRILGYDKASITGSSIQNILFLEEEWNQIARELMGSSTKNYSTADFLHSLANNKQHNLGEWTMKGKDGIIVPVLLSVSEIIQDKNTDGYLFAATDISQIKSIQKELEQKNEELEQFAYITAHDLKEPLRGITSYLSILQKKYSTHLDEKANSYINIASHSAKRMKTLISDILDFSKTGVIEQKEVNLNSLLDTIFDNYRNDINQNNLVLSKSNLPVLTGDTTSFIQLFTNLIDNAIKYQSKGNRAQVDIYGEEDEKNWVFTVADNGIGIKREHQDRVFEVFKRLHSNSEYSGTGIGLATCKKIVSAYGGKIWFEANQSQGTKFVFTIPKTKDNIER